MSDRFQRFRCTEYVSACKRCSLKHIMFEVLQPSEAKQNCDVQNFELKPIEENLRASINIIFTMIMQNHRTWNPCHNH